MKYPAFLIGFAIISVSSFIYSSSSSRALAVRGSNQPRNNSMTKRSTVDREEILTCGMTRKQHQQAEFTFFRTLDQNKKLEKENDELKKALYLYETEKKNIEKKQQRGLGANNQREDEDVAEKHLQEALGRANYFLELKQQEIEYIKTEYKHKKEKYKQRLIDTQEQHTKNLVICCIGTAIFTWLLSKSCTLTNSNSVK